MIHHGDNVKVMRGMQDASVDMIYMDPPFYTQKDWGAFEDKWAGMVHYISRMREVCTEGRRLLRRTGSLFLHCDWRASHRLRVMLDAVFGMDNFVNEIIWKRTVGAGNQSKLRYGSEKDTILFYCKDFNIKTFTMQFKKYEEGYLKSRYRNSINGRRFTHGNISSPTNNENTKYEYKGHKPPAKGWSLSKSTMEYLDKKGLLYFPKDKSKSIRKIIYLDELPGNSVTDLWTDIPPVNSQAHERTGYPTQKPIALLRRIILCATDPGDTVLDPFMGSGTACVAAKALGREYVGIDKSDEAVRIARDRLGIREAA